MGVSQSRSRGAPRSQYVRVRVPRTVAKRLPSTIHIRPAYQYPPRRPVRIRAKYQPLVTRRVKIVHPRRVRTPIRGYANVYSRRNLTVHGQRAANRRVRDERNRFRKRERKWRQRINRLMGQLHSVRSDRHGIVSANLRSGASIKQLELAAAISRSF